MFVDLIAQVRETVGDVELGVRTVAIGTVVVEGDKAAEVADIVAVVHHVFLGIVRAIHDTGLRAASFLLMMAGDDVDHPSHRVRAIHQGARASDHFHAFDVGSHVGVGQGMSEDPRPLRLSVEEHEYFVSLSHPADVDGSGRPVVHPEAGDPFLGDEQSGDTLREYRKECRLAAGFDLLPVDHGYGERHAVAVHLYLISRDDNALKVDQAVYSQRFNGLNRHGRVNNRSDQ